MITRPSRRSGANAGEDVLDRPDEEIATNRSPGSAWRTDRSKAVAYVVVQMAVRQRVLEDARTPTGSRIHLHVLVAADLRCR